MEVREYFSVSPITSRKPSREATQGPPRQGSRTNGAKGADRERGSEKKVPN